MPERSSCHLEARFWTRIDGGERETALILFLPHAAAMSRTKNRSPSPSEASESEDDAQARLLQLLNAQCAASLGAELPVASTSRLAADSEEDDEEDVDSNSDGEDDEWTGFGDDNDALSIAGHPANSKQPVVVSFEDAVRNGKRKFDETEVASFGQKDNFMVSRPLSCKY